MPMAALAIRRHHYLVLIATCKKFKRWRLLENRRFWFTGGMSASLAVTDSVLTSRQAKQHDGTCMQI